MPRRGSFICPACGEEVPAGAKSCPECGSDENTGWSDQTVYDGTDIPDEKDFDYEKTLVNEGLAKPKRSPNRLAVVAVAIVLLGALILLFVLNR